MSSDTGGRRCCSCCGVKGGGKGGSCSRQGSSQGQCGDDGSGWKVTSQGFGVSPFPAVDSFLRSVMVILGGSVGLLLLVVVVVVWSWSWSWLLLSGLISL